MTLEPRSCFRFLGTAVLLLAALGVRARAQSARSAGAEAFAFNDSHFHLTNYIQRGIELDAFLRIMGSRVGRVALFGIPLQQEWLDNVTGENAPSYYLHSDAPLYYYSFTDADIAMRYRALKPEDRARFDPMITGFNPGDMYAADHIRRVLRTFPGVFTGIGEFTVHKEFVSDKVRPGPASLLSPALDSILGLAGEVGLVVILHNDVDVPFAKAGARPAYLEQMRDRIARHPETTIIWAHTGVGRVVRPVANHLAMLESLMRDPALRQLHFDISWDEVAKYIVASDSSIALTAAVVNRYPERFLFGTDVVAPPDAHQYFRVADLYRPFLDRLTPESRALVLRGNYERLFGTARQRVRAWEARALANGDGKSSTR